MILITREITREITRVIVKVLMYKKVQIDLEEVTNIVDIEIPSLIIVQSIVQCRTDLYTVIKTQRMLLP